MPQGHKADPGLAMAKLLRELMQHAGLTVRSVEEESRNRRSTAGQAAGYLSKSTVGELIRHKQPRWPTRQQFEIFVDTCLSYAGARARSFPIHLRDAELDRRYWELSEQRARSSKVSLEVRPLITVPMQLPPAIRGFVGRVKELAELSRLLDDRNNRSPAVVVSTICGSPGIGKTELAVQWAHTVQGRFPGGTLYINLRGHDHESPVTAENALDGFLRKLDVPTEAIPTELDALVARYRSVLNKRRMLVLLDNAASVNQVRPLLPASPGCMAIITSRNQLSALTVRESAHPIALDLLSPAEQWNC